MNDPTPSESAATKSLNSQATSVRVTKSDGDSRETTDFVATEEPLEVQVNGKPLAVTMRTPGHDQDLVYGFVLTEGIVLRPDEITLVEQVDESHVNVELRDDIAIDLKQFERNMFVSSSCGVCGKASIEQVELLCRPPDPFTVPASVIRHLTRSLRTHQPTFDVTGGLHAAGLYDVRGHVLSVREDVGRHNAVDKAIGAAMQVQWPLPSCLLVVSGRQSFEIVQKAALGGVGGVIGVSAPSSLAVQLAEKLNMLLVGFARDGMFNIYAGHQRVV